MVDVDGSSLPADSLAKSVGLVWGLALSPHLSNEPDELSPWLQQDDSTINTVIGIIIMPHHSTS